MKDCINDAVPWLLPHPHSTWTTVSPALTSALCLGADADEPWEIFHTAGDLAVVSMHGPYGEGSPSQNFMAGFWQRSASPPPDRHCKAAGFARRH